MRADWDWGVSLLDAGILLGLAGALSLAKPLRFLGIRTRGSGGGVLFAGFLVGLIGVLLPAPERSTEGERSRLDEFLPVFQFREVHSTRIRASPESIFRAVRDVTAGEIRFFRLLTWIRSPRWPGTGEESILAAPADRPLLEVALRSGFVLLAEDPGREIVFGTLLCGRAVGVSSALPASFASFSRPGFCKAAMNFRIGEVDGGFARLTTETRVFALGSSARRRFAAYWRLIYPGSALIRRMWLEAVRRRAEDPVGPCRDELERLLAPVDESLTAYETGSPPGDPQRAQTVLAQARRVRETLEAASLGTGCRESRREALISLNHLVLAFQGYLGGPRDKKAMETVDSIVRRARSHERRAIPEP